MKRPIIALIAVTISASFAWASLDDKSDRLSNEQSNTFSPGYINATMSKTREIINQARYDKSPMDNIENKDEIADNKLSNKVGEKATDKVSPELKKKTGGGESVKNSSDAANTNKVTMNVGEYETNKGKGQNQHFETASNGRQYFVEEFNGVRYIYAGFGVIGEQSSNVIQGAVEIAGRGGIVAVSAGTYAGDVSLSSDVKLCGGYKEDGARDFLNSATIINGDVSLSYTNNSELNGFTIVGHWNTDWAVGPGWLPAAVVNASRSNNVTIANNTINGNFNGAYAIYSGVASDITIKNNSITSDYLPVWLTSATNANIIGNEMRAYLSVVPCGCGFTSMNNNYYFSGSALGGGGGGAIISTGDYYSNPVEGTSNLQLSDMHDTPNILDFGKAGIATNSVSSTQSNLAISSVYNNYYNKQRYGDESAGMNGYAITSKLIQGYSSDSGNVSSVLKAFIANKITEQPNPMFAQQIARNASALSIPVGVPNPQEIRMALVLASILKNPTEDQKLILDSITSLMNDVSKQEDANQSPEVKKAQDDLIQVVANILIAQAIPDLLKEGDAANIKGIFNDLDSEKVKLLSDYSQSLKPYYAEIKKLLSRNLAMLQLNNIVSKTMMQEELNKLEPNDIDRIIEKIRKMQNTSFEANYMVQEEAKLHSKYIDPSKKVFEEKMKAMLEGFTKKLSKILEATKK